MRTTRNTTIFAEAQQTQKVMKALEGKKKKKFVERNSKKGTNVPHFERQEKENG